MEVDSYSPLNMLSDAQNPFSVFFRQHVLPSVGKRNLDYVLKTVYPAIHWNDGATADGYGQTYIDDQKRLCVDLDWNLFGSLPCLHATFFRELVHAVRLYASTHGKTPEPTSSDDMGVAMQEACLGGVAELAGVRVKLPGGGTELRKYTKANLADLDLEGWKPARKAHRVLGKCGKHRRVEEKRQLRKRT